jgi:psp operon transcriptional activator
VTTVEGTVPSDFRAAVAKFERQVLRRALERAQFKQTVAAKLLGLSYHQFRSLLRKHGLAKSVAENGD